MAWTSWSMCLCGYSRLWSQEHLLRDAAPVLSSAPKHPPFLGGCALVSTTSRAFYESFTSFALVSPSQNYLAARGLTWKNMLTESLGALQRGVFLLSGELGAPLSSGTWVLCCCEEPDPPGNLCSACPLSLTHSFGLCPHWQRKVPVQLDLFESWV